MADASKLTVTVRLSWFLGVVLSALRNGLGPREWALSFGWLMLTVGAGLRFGAGWGLIVGGACMFAISVFGVVPAPPTEAGDR